MPKTDLRSKNSTTKLSRKSRAFPVAIDRQLYAKCGLTEDEVAFIERMIKPME